MRIAISATGREPSSDVDTRFGRAAWFLIHHTDHRSWQAIENQSNLEAPHGAGVEAAKLVSDHGVGAVITGSCGLKAFQVLAAGKIRVYRGDGRSVAAAVKAFEEGRLPEIREGSGQ
jgi:predicted Fe-Mo cluster-binding NifX family protein